MGEIDRKAARLRRHKRVRKNVSGTAKTPRLSVFKSNSHIYAQLIDDVGANTLVSASTLDADMRKKHKAVNIDAAKEVGTLLATRSKDKGIDRVVFDRGGFIYHGKVKALADGAREGGLVF